MRPSDRRLGVSLVELLIVLSIVGLLLAVAVPRLTRARDRAYEATLTADLERLNYLQEQHRALGARAYTTDLAALDFVASEGVTLAVTDASVTGWASQASHRAQPDLYCSVFSGSGQARPPWPATQPGEINCGRRRGGSSGSPGSGVILP